MKRLISSFIFPLGATVVTVVSGCGGGGSSGPSTPRANIYAQTSIAGVIQAWTGAKLSGNAAGPSYECDLLVIIIAT